MMMGSGVLRGLALAGGVLFMPMGAAFADAAGDLKLCLTAGDTYDGDVEDACDAYIALKSGTASDRAKAYFSRARVVAADGDYDSALDDIDASIELVPATRSYLYRGLYLAENGEQADAIADFDTVLKKEPRNADALYLRGRSYYDSDDYDKAEADYTKAIEIAPKHANAYLWRGHLYADDFDFESALSDYTHAIEFGAGADAYYSRAEVYYFDLEEEKAIADLDVVLKQFPNDIESHRLRAECYDALEQYDQAIADYDAILRVAEKDDAALSARAAVFVKKGNGAAAVYDYTAAIAIKPNKSYYIGRANAYRAAGDLDKAIADRKAAAENTPVSGDFLQLALLYKENGNAADADTALMNGLELANKAVAANDNYASNYADRAEIYRAMGQNDLALANYDEALKRASANPDYYEKRAAVQDALGNADAAEADRAAAARLKAGQSADASDDEADDGAAAPAKGSSTMRSMH